MTHFKKGISGNPKGRPKGIVDKRQKLRVALEERAEELLEVMIQQALEGDAQIQKILLSRILSPAKGEYAPAMLNLKSGSFTGLSFSIFQSAANGDISLTTASELLSALNLSMKIKETEELEWRVSKIEEKLGVKT